MPFVDFFCSMYLSKDIDAMSHSMIFDNLSPEQTLRGVGMRPQKWHFLQKIKFPHTSQILKWVT